MSAAGLAAGVVTPPVLVRQRNTLSWQYELQFRGHVVVSLDTVRAYKAAIEIDGNKVECPEGCIVLVDPNYGRISEPECRENNLRG